MKLYNTLTRKKDDFIPSSDTVKMYSCGPTVYNYAHIGNLRTYIFMDLLRRALKLNGYKIMGVMNITDVGHLMSDADEGEDKMVKASVEQKKSPAEIAEYYTKVFFEDLEKLNIEKTELTPKATDHIEEMIEFVKALLKKGYAYEAQDGIYFDISKFPQYGLLSKGNTEQIAGARVDINTNKRNPSDFALWKHAPKEHIMQWKSPWGMGYPGWHIECSAMSRKYLGDVFDIHSGGVDHIPIHHENEIAQSQALTGKQPAKFWLHGEFMMVDGGKMSKKLGNVYTLSQLEDMGYSPMVFRFFCLNAHYRKTLNFTFTALDAAKTAYNRLCENLYEHKISNEGGDKQKIDGFIKEFDNAVSDDLNIPKALGILFTMLKEPKSNDIYQATLYMDRVLGLNLSAAPENANESGSQIPQNVIDLAQERQLARQQKDFARSDILREEILRLGYKISDKKDGYELEKI
jgi:cysteinyl-tRNA synthetase